MGSRRWLVGLIAAVAAACGPFGSDPEHHPDAQGATDASTAPDAAPRCGDEILQPGETCDPQWTCPLQCEPRTCATWALAGSSVTCDVTCDYTPITQCIPSDGCCAPQCTAALDNDCLGIRIDAGYVPTYTLRDLGPVPGVPARLGGLTVKAGDPTKLLVGGTANTTTGALYEIGLVRDAQNHIIGFDPAAPATRLIDAQYNDGGVAYGPDGVLFLARWPANELGQTKAGSTITDKVIPLDTIPVAHSVAGTAIAPAGYPGAGTLKLLSWGGGQWYTAKLVPDMMGTFDVTEVTLKGTLTGGTEGMVYVPAGSPLFPRPAVLVSEWTAGIVSTYEVDDNGDPILATRKLFIINLMGAEGATIDPMSGDFLFSTFGGGDRVIVVKGFLPPESG